MRMQRRRFFCSDRLTYKQGRSTALILLLQDLETGSPASGPFCCCHVVGVRVSCSSALELCGAMSGAQSDQSRERASQLHQAPSKTSSGKSFPKTSHLVHFHLTFRSLSKKPNARSPGRVSACTRPLSPIIEFG